MSKSKLSIKEIIHEGAMVCFDWIDYLNENPPDYTFGFDPTLWEKDNKANEFEKLQKYHIEAVEYIKKHNIESSKYDFDFQEDYLNDNHYLSLAILGNKVEYVIFKHMTQKEMTNHFLDEDFYYTSDEVQHAIEFAQTKLDAIIKK